MLERNRICGSPLQTELEDQKSDIGGKMEEGGGEQGIGFFAEPAEEQRGEENQDPVGRGRDCEMREREQGRGDEQAGAERRG